MIDFQKRYFKIAQAFIQKYKEDKNILGITLGGGIARGTGDIYSEIDLAFYVKNVKANNLPPKGDTDVNGVWFDFKIIDYSAELKNKLNMYAKWDLKHCKILFQRKNLITDLIHKKAVLDKSELKDLLHENIQLGGWSINLAEIFVNRGDIRNAHLLLNQSIEHAVNLYFIKNKEFVPYFKWKYFYFNRLKNPNKNIKRLIYDASIIKDYSENELKRRINILKRIYTDLGEEYAPHYTQNISSLNNFESSIKKGVKLKRHRWT